jgi:hypothetical protein
MERYVCKECGAEVTWGDRGMVRSCEHTGTVILEMAVVTSGVGGCDA